MFDAGLQVADRHEVLVGDGHGRAACCSSGRTARPCWRRGPRVRLLPDSGATLAAPGPKWECRSCSGPGCRAATLLRRGRSNRLRYHCRSGLGGCTRPALADVSAHALHTPKVRRLVKMFPTMSALHKGIHVCTRAAWCARLRQMLPAATAFWTSPLREWSFNAPRSGETQLTSQRERRASNTRSLGNHVSLRFARFKALVLARAHSRTAEKSIRQAHQLELTTREW